MDGQLILMTSLAICVSLTRCCELPARLAGHWNIGTGPLGTASLEVNATSFKTLSVNSKISRDFSCVLSQNNTYIVRSTPLVILGMPAHYYMCLDIIPSDSNLDVVFFRLRTSKTDNEDYPFLGMAESNTANQNLSFICAQAASEFPLHFNVLSKTGAEEKVGANACPPALHSQFAATISQQPEAQCPDGLLIDGCADKSRLLFNYSGCGGNETSYGAVNYTCLSTTRAGNKTFTTIFLHDGEGQKPQNNAYQLSCLEFDSLEDGEVNITKSAEVCGAASPVLFVANETSSCHTPIVPEPTTQQGTYPVPNVTGSAQALPNVTTRAGSNIGGGLTSSSAVEVYCGLLSLLLPSVLLVFRA